MTTIYYKLTMQELFNSLKCNDLRGARACLKLLKMYHREGMLLK